MLKVIWQYPAVITPCRHGMKQYLDRDGYVVNTCASCSNPIDQTQKAVKLDEGKFITQALSALSSMGIKNKHVLVKTFKYMFFKYYHKAFDRDFERIVYKSYLQYSEAIPLHDTPLCDMIDTIGKMDLAVNI